MKRQYKKNSDNIVVFTCIALFMIYPLLQYEITKHYVVDGRIEKAMNWMFELGLWLTNGLGRGMGLGFEALLLLVPLMVFCAIFLGVISGEAVKKIFKQMDQKLVALILVIVFLVYHGGLVIYLHKTSDLAEKVIPINNDYKLVIGKVSKAYKEDALWVNFRVLKNDSGVKAKYIDIKVIKGEQPFTPITQLGYSCQFKYVQPPFDIKVGQIILDAHNDVQTISLAVYKNIKIKKVIDPGY